MIAARLGALVTFMALAGCGSELDLGSDLLWTARFESANFDELTSVGGDASAFPSDASITVSDERAHTGRYGAKLTINTAGNLQENAGLARSGDLPVEAYYSVWYYLPRSVTVGTYWVIFKFRMRSDANDPGSTGELFDLNLANLSTGEMTLRIYDHRTVGDIPLDVPAPVVPVGAWFQVEGFYRNAPDDTGRLTFWLDGHQLVDLRGPMAPSPWIAWDATSVAFDLTPATATIHVDDCAISRSRVGPDGILGR
jgi:hypothetical protein